MDVYSLLNQLSDGAFHSGSSLGASLGVSRAAIWKAVGRLTELNLDIETIKGKGYRLRGGVDLLTYHQIFKHLSKENQKQAEITLLLSTESTNKWLMQKDNQGRADKQFEFCVSEMQTNGKGRRGKSWVSPFGKNVYLSCAFELQGGVEVLNGLSLVVGLAVIRALKEIGLNNAVLKWPNDIWIDSKKAAGILVELQGEATTGWRVVAGVGLNVSMELEDGSAIDQPWVSIGENVECQRNKVVGLLINSLIQVIKEFQLCGFEGFMEEWEDSDCLKGEYVKTTAGLEGVAKGVNSHGLLMIETKVGPELINAGEVSVRPV